MENKEIFKIIENAGYTRKYYISNYGNVKSNIKDKNMILQIDKEGYNYIYLYCEDKKRRRFQIHKLVAKYFINNPNNYNCINHIDGNKLNNKVDNLEWCTNKENTHHAIRNNLFGEHNGKKKAVIQYDLNGNIINKWKSQGEISRTLGYTQQCISKCCTKKRKKYKGFIWRFADE